PSFVVVLLNLQSHLAARSRAIEQRLVGTPIDVQMNVEKFRPEVSFLTPGTSEAARLRVDATAVKPDTDSAVYTTSLGKPTAGQMATETLRSGLYEAWQSTSAGGYEVKRFALNVEPSEGDLALADPQQMVSRLDPVKPIYRTADDFEAETTDEAGFNISLLLM